MVWLQKNTLLIFALILVVAAVGIWWWKHNQEPISLVGPFIKETEVVEPPLEKYAIPRLAERQYQPSDIIIERELDANDDFTSYIFSYRTLDKKMTGQLNVPKTVTDGQTVQAIIMLRGYVPPEIFSTGVGTKNGAAYLARQGYVTLAPDFFSYGGSDPEPEDTWQARFEKPITVAELLKTLQSKPLQVPAVDGPATTTGRTLTVSDIGMWAHSNGGQIALTTLEIVGEPIPTTLWAPVTAPFPYSILFFSDEYADEGKETRKYIAVFEKTYDVFDFSLTKHLDLLTGPLQLHHGTADDAALPAWSAEFVDKIKVENQRRLELKTTSATDSATLSAQPQTSRPKPLEPIVIEYYTYPGADHNLQPSWDTVIQRDVDFFKKHLTSR